MQAKVGDSVMVIGNATRDAELKHVGDKNTPLTKFSLAIGKDKDDNGIFVDCAAWRRLAYCASGIKKGDTVMVIGKIESREHEGKTYKTLNAEWVDVKGQTVQKPQEQSAQPAQAYVPDGLYPLPTDDDDLPF